MPAASNMVFVAYVYPWHSRNPYKCLPYGVYIHIIIYNHYIYICNSIYIIHIYIYIIIIYIYTVYVYIYIIIIYIYTVYVNVYIYICVWYMGIHGISMVYKSRMDPIRLPRSSRLPGNRPGKGWCSARAWHGPLHLLWRIFVRARRQGMGDSSNKHGNVHPPSDCFLPQK